MTSKPAFASLPVLCLWIVVVLVGAKAALAAPFATVEATRGQVVARDENGQPRTIAPRVQVYEGDVIETGNDGELHLLTIDDGLLALRPNSRLKVEHYRTDGKDAGIGMSLFNGALRTVTGWFTKREPQSYRLNTPTATIGVRGTDHDTTVIERDGDDPAGTYNRVLQGRTLLRTAAGGEIELAPGQHGHARVDGGLRRLSQAPRFVALRASRLRLEARVAQRREALRPRVQQRLQQLERQQQPQRQRAATTPPGGAPGEQLPQRSAARREAQAERQAELRAERQAERRERRLEQGRPGQTEPRAQTVQPPKREPRPETPPQPKP